MGKILKRQGVLLILFILLGCVAKSHIDGRFKDSPVLPALSLTIPDPNNLKFIMVGDLHVGHDTNRLRSILQQATSDQNQFAIFLGDIVDKGEREEYEALRTAVLETGWSQKVLYVIGNHDIFEEGWTYWKEFFGPSYYNITIGNSRFIALDTADGSLGDEQINWLKNELTKSKASTFLLSHYLPVIPKQKTYLKLSNQEEALKALNLAHVHGVSGWFGAHYHSYIKDTIEGVDIVVAGGGGGRRMDPIKSFFYVQVTLQNQQIQYELKIID